jgi:hypothetical protein
MAPAPLLLSPGITVTMNAQTTAAVVVSVATAYLLLVRHRRFKRTHAMARKLGYEGLSREEIYKKMTLRDAEIIQRTLSELEFPFIYTTALQFALFRVCNVSPPLGSV